MVYKLYFSQLECSNWMWVLMTMFNLPEQNCVHGVEIVQASRTRTSKFSLEAKNQFVFLFWLLREPLHHVTAVGFLCAACYNSLWLLSHYGLSKILAWFKNKQNAYWIYSIAKNLKFNVWVFSFKKMRRSDQLLRVNLIPWPLLAWFWSQDSFLIVYISGGGTDILRLQAKRNNNNKKWFLLLIFIIPLVGLYCRFKNKVPFRWFWKATSGMQWTSEMWRNIHVPDQFFVSCGKTFQ